METFRWEEANPLLSRIWWESSGGLWTTLSRELSEDAMDVLVGRVGRSMPADKLLPPGDAPLAVLPHESK